MEDKNLTYDTIDPKTRTIIMTGLAIALFAACFDGTITTTCGPKIAEEFKASDLLPWLTTAYLLMETITIPLSGKLSDLYGRKKLLIIGLALFGAASFFAGIAWDMWVVIIARAFQGAGGGILIPVATAAVSDLYAPEDRGKIQGLLGALFGIGMGAGPLIGGFFTGLGSVGPLSGWHFAFLINLVIVLLVFILCKKEFPAVVVDQKPIIDYKGTCLISLALLLVVLYFQFVGKAFDLFDLVSLGFILLILVLLKLFFMVEAKSAEPIIAPHIFQNHTVRSAAILLFLLGFTLVGDELFMGMYLQRITNHTAMEAGLFILIMVIGMIITSVIGGIYLNKTGIKPWVIAGPVLMAVGFMLFAGITTEFNVGLFAFSEFLYGLGTGCLLASLMTAVQNCCEHREVGMTTSAVNLMRNIGSTVGTSVFTLMVNAAIYFEARDKGLDESLASLGMGILDKLGEVTAEVAKKICEVFTDSVAFAFGIGSLILLIAVIVGLRFRVVSMEQTKDISEYDANLTKDNKKY